MIEVAAHHLDFINDFASTKCNISKDLKQALWKSIMVARYDHKKLEATTAAAELTKTKISISTQTEAFTFAGSPKSAYWLRVTSNRRSV